MTRKNYIWDQIKRDFKSGIPKSEFETWLSQASLKKIDSDQAVIEVPNKFVARWLRDNYTDHIQTVLKNNLEILPEIRFTCTPPSANKESAEEGPTGNLDAGTRQGLNILKTFSSFVTAKSNRLAYSSALNVVDSPSTTYNPLYIFSELSLERPIS